MKKYTRLNIEISHASDVIATSADVTTGGIKFPWTKDDGVSTYSYELLSFKNLSTGSENLYET